MKATNKKKLSMILLALVVIFTFAIASPAFAQSGTPPTADQVNDITLSINIFWMIMGGFLVFFMQAGFALVETGFTRNKNVTHTMMMNMMVFGIGAIGYWLTGFAFQFGAVNAAYPAVTTVGAVAGEWAHSPITLGDWTGLMASPLLRFGQFGLLGGSGFMLMGIPATASGIFAFFLFQMVFMDTAATIPTGSMAERLKFIGFVFMGLWVSMFIYPLVGGWIWGGGWLQNLGRIAGLGNGAVDFAGSGVVHMIGGCVGLAGAVVLGPRIGKFNKDGSANTIPGHNITIGVLGTIILFFGWFGFNPGSSLGFTGAFRNLAVIAAVNTLLAGGASACSAMTYMWLFGPSKKPDAGMSVNGMLAGLVAITAPCAFVDPWAAVVIGIIAGVLVCLAVVWLEKLHIDDPVGAVPVHMVNGAWGVLSVGIFANGNPDTAAWNGMQSAVTGLLYGGSTQILAQFAEAISIFVVVFGLSWCFFKVCNSFGLLRVSRKDELEGLDMPEMGSLAYPVDWEAPADAI